MTQFKAKCQSHADNINMGLMDYPVLMAADILLYQTELVPVGADQKQHLELARDLAIRFNNRYGDTFAVPEPYIAKSGARVMSLADPTKKMSKSDENVNGFISMNDDPDTIMRKFRRAVTDSDTTVRFDKEKPGISNLLTIYSVCADVSIAQAEAEFAGVGYGDFKQRVGEAVVEKLRPIQDAKKKFAADKAYLTAVMAKGAENAERIAYKTLRKVYKKVGFVPRERV
jgi:tryptophanyl-tRNA synthetase